MRRVYQISAAILFSALLMSGCSHDGANETLPSTPNVLARNTDGASPVTLDNVVYFGIAKRHSSYLVAFGRYDTFRHAFEPNLEFPKDTTPICAGIATYGLSSDGRAFYCGALIYATVNYRLWAIDPLTGNVSGKALIPGGWYAFTPGLDARLYLATDPDFLYSGIYAVNETTLGVTGKIPFAYTTIGQIAVDAADRNRLYAVNDAQTVYEIDTSTHKATSVVHLPSKGLVVWSGMQVAPSGAYAYLFRSAAGYTIASRLVFATKHLTDEETFHGKAIVNPFSGFFNRSGSSFYLLTKGRIERVDPTIDRVVATTKFFGSNTQAVLSASQKQLYVADTDHPTILSVLDASSLDTVRTIPLPSDVQYTPPMFAH